MDNLELQWNSPFDSEIIDDLPWFSGLEDLECTGDGFSSSIAGDITHGTELFNQTFDGTPGNASLDVMANTVIRPGSGKDLSAPLHSRLQDNFPDVRQRQHAQSLPRRRSKYILRKSGSQTRPVATPTFDLGYGDARITFTAALNEQPLMMERWRNSPPRDEAASLSAICRALERPVEGTQLPVGCLELTQSLKTDRRPPSITSLDSGTSASSLASATSSQSTASRNSRSTRLSRKRGKLTRTAKGGSMDERIFKCTFCCDTFKHKYDWARHERSLHLNVEEWRCAPHGGAVLLSATDGTYCAYCSAIDPTPDHLEQHNHSACHNDRSSPRAFRRKDHLVQHLRLFHGIDTMPAINNWKVDLPPIVSRCGFCDAVLNSWDERVEHLATHFRMGKTMTSWRGEHGFDARVAARVTYSLPPYLIANDSMSLIPFSATNPASRDHFKQISSQIDRSVSLTSEIPNPIEEPIPPAEDFLGQRAPDKFTFADMLTRHLSRYARHQMSRGIIPTDEMFQRESRRIMYHDEDDNWNQTLADSADWLKMFRLHSGLEE